MKPSLGLALAALVSLAFQPGSSGATWQLTGAKLFEASVTDHLRLSSDGSGLELDSGELFEDDGPAAGHSYQEPKNQEQLTADTRIKKLLIIPNPSARSAFLIVLTEDSLQAAVNDQALHLGTNQSGRHSYQAYRFDPRLLRPGTNQIVLQGSGKVAIARDDEFGLGSRTRTGHPNRSAKSTDGGKSWDYDHLGPDGKLDGEYGVRIFLDHYRPRGSLTLPVVDAGNLEGRPIGPSVSEMGPVTIAVQGKTGLGSRVVVRARSGSDLIPSEKTWSSWQELGASGGIIEKPSGRYLQIALDLSTADPLTTPQVSSVQVRAEPVRPVDWTTQLRVVQEQNEAIIRTSIPFAYEPLDHPRLKQLREQYKLDQVVEGAQTELELLLRLAQWACNSWDWPNHIFEKYPPWDALEILKPHRDGTPTGGFCQQFNLVFLQACESFGFNGRAVSISQGPMQIEHPGGGHEIVEIWSNEWRKWVYVDGALAWYVVDDKTGMPLSILEMRQRQLPTLHHESAPPVRLVDAPRTRNKQFGWTGLASPKPSNWYLELRMIPRSSFLQEKAPLPLNQGTEEWSWTGHYVWTDEQAPAGLVFDERIAKRNNFEWTLNQAHYVLEPGEKPGTLRVHLDTETPSFDTFLAEIDAESKQPVASGFSWNLHPGTNHLRVRPRNVAGREGIPSSVAVEFQLP